MIEVDNLTKKYGNFTAVNGISFKTEPGEIMGFLGPNGAGKTTTMRMLTGFMPPTSGTALVAGFDIFEQSIAVRKHVGYLPETVPLYPDMTVKGYVKYIAELRGVMEAEDRTEDVLKIVGMYERRDSLIRSISKGMRQRVGLAQALVHDPEVLILDEPTIGLDPLQTLEVRDLVRGLGKGHTLLFSTHILSEAEQVCDRVTIINHGQIVAVDSPANLRERLQEGARLFIRVGSSDSADLVIKALHEVVGVAGVEPYTDGFIITSQDNIDVRSRLAEGVVSKGWSLLELRPLAISLEDIFIELTQEQTRRSSKEGERVRPKKQDKERAKSHA